MFFVQILINTHLPPKCCSLPFPCFFWPYFYTHHHFRLTALALSESLNPKGIRTAPLYLYLYPREAAGLLNQPQHHREDRSMMSLLRFRQPSPLPSSTAHRARIIHLDEGKKKGNTNKISFFKRNKARVFIILSVYLCVFLVIKATDSTKNFKANTHEDTSVKQERTVDSQSQATMGGIIYGAKSKGSDTSTLVQEAIRAGFRHIATV